MPKTNEDNIKEKLEYIGLDLENIPEFFMEHKQLEYKPLRIDQENENCYRVYKYVPITKIQILLTQSNRLDTTKEKYLKSSTLESYLNPKEEEDIIKHTIFLKMLNDVKIEEIQKIEQQQKRLNKQIPFKVKFEENYLWQIYYSDISDTYFMLAPTEELEYASFFYLLKKQIECNKNGKEEMIFVPIVHENYSGKYLRQSEIQDAEKYLWLFTKEWANIYEVYDKKENMCIYIIGETTVYENIKTFYRIILKNKEEAIKLYKLIKALFILQTELPHHYKFSCKINRYGVLEFEYNNKKITYETLANLLNIGYRKAKELISDLQKEKVELKQELENLKIKSNNFEKEYIMKEKQIAMYLECKKTFLGRVKYFFKSKKLKKNSNNNIEKEESEIPDGSNQKDESLFIEKEYYTIEDIIDIYYKLDKILIEAKNLRLDTNAMQNKVKNIEQKIKNATLYIDEIDSHEKSIFEFWKFANKDENLLLNQGSVENNIQTNKIEKVYDYNDDFEEIGNLIDKEQRKILNKQQQDAVYITSTEIINVLNNMDEEKIEESLSNLKQEAQENRELFNIEKLDIFGSIAEDKTKIKMLGNKKHREVKKDKLKILEINKDTTVEEYKEKLNTINNNIQKSIEDSKSKLKMSAYKLLNDKEDITGLNVLELSAQECIEQLKENSGVLYKINIEEGMKVIYFVNSVYYDNHNKTLPLGMDIEQKCLIDINKYEMKLIKKDNFRWNESIDEFKVNTKKVDVYEYDIVEKTGDAVNDK